MESLELSYLEVTGGEKMEWLVTVRIDVFIYVVCFVFESVGVILIQNEVMCFAILWTTALLLHRIVSKDTIYVNYF